MEKKLLHMVAHTHWDREWYFTIEDSNILLGENMNLTIDTLEKDPNFLSYSFDAQASLVEEFLKIFPEKRDNLKKLIEDKRIYVGPWYTQTDTLLVNKESIIRNLLYGTKICNSFGHSMNVGYIPDVFGQNAYLPSIFRDFNIDYAMLKRGVYLDELKGNDNFNWKSPNGATIKTNYMSVGYSAGEYLSDSIDHIKNELLPMADKINKNNMDSNHLLYLTGGDQNRINKNMPEMIKKINESQDRYTLVMSNLEKFMDDSWAKDFDVTLHGELRGTGNQRIHRTVGSMRYDIKQINSDVENKILHILEPLAVIAEQVGIPYPKPWLDSMWKLLFDVHAHDSMGCCNSDATNDEVLNRVIKVKKMTYALINLLKKKITYAISEKLKLDNILVLFNTNIKESSSFTKSVIFTREKNIALKDLNGNTLASEIISQTYISGGKKIILTDKGDVEVEVPGYYRTEILVKCVIPSMGWTTVSIHGVNTEKSFKHSDSNKISNEDISIEFLENSVNISNNGTIIKDAFYFENTADFGDSYDYSPLIGDLAILAKNFNLISCEKGNFCERLTFETKLLLPKDLEERKLNKNSETLVIKSVFELRKDENFIRVSHDILNNIKDHRVRAIIKTGLSNIEASYSDNGFSLVEHSIIEKRMEIWKEKNYVEAPVPIYNMENIVLVRNNEKLVGVITKGIKEYEIVENSIAITLYRSVGLLGRDNLVWRPNRASGINNTVVYTPKGQIQGELDFSYAIYFDTNVSDNKIFNTVESFIEKSCSYQKQDLNSLEERIDRFNIPFLDYTLNENSSLFTLDNKELILSCCKKSYDSNNIILRIFNPENENKTFNISGSLIKAIFKTNLAEEEIEKVSGSISINKKDYVTLKLIIK